MSVESLAGVDGTEDPGAGTENSPRLTFRVHAPAPQRVLRQPLYVAARRSRSICLPYVELLHGDRRAS